MKAKRTKKLNLQWSRSTRLEFSFAVIKTRAPKRAKAPKRVRAVKRHKAPSLFAAIGSRTRAAASAVKGALSATVSWLKPAVPFAFMTLGVAGMLYFGLKTGQARKLERVTTFNIPAPVATAPILKPEAPKGLARSEPTRIRIPSVEIDYPVINMGRNDDGTMEIPKLFDPVTGWYKYSPTPGEIGPSVIVGHVDTYKGPSVFWRLGQVKPGDIAEVTRADGSVVKFKVDALKQFEQNNFPTAEVYGNLDHAGLRLITCGGTFNRATNSYSQNTVVFASIVI